MKIVKQSLRQVSPQLYKKLYSLNFRREGTMQDTLRDKRHNKKEMVHYILDGTKLIGWSLLFENDAGMQCHFYVRKSERRKGYGRRLFHANMRYTKRLGKTFKVLTDKSNRKFFKEVKAKTRER